MDPVVENDVDHLEIGFEHFKLKPGLVLELHDDAGRLLPYKAQFVMSYPGKGVLVSLLAGDPQHIALEPGSYCQLSGFTGKFDFSFKTRARKVDRSQFTAMLATPPAVTVRFVRKHPRISLTLPGEAASPHDRVNEPITIRSLSMGGAALSSTRPLGAKGEPLMLQLQVMFENRVVPIRLSTVVRRSWHTRESARYDVGVEFVNASRMDKLLLHYYLSTQADEYAVV